MWLTLLFVPQVKRMYPYNDLDDARVKEVTTALIQKIGLSDEFSFNGIVQTLGDPTGEAAMFTKTYAWNTGNLCRSLK